MALRNNDEQIEFVRLTGAMMEQVKESIPQIETTEEARSFVISKTINQNWLGKNKRRFK